MHIYTLNWLYSVSVNEYRTYKHLNATQTLIPVFSAAVANILLAAGAAVLQISPAPPPSSCLV